MVKSLYLIIFFLNLFGASIGQLSRLIQIISRTCDVADDTTCAGNGVTFWLYTNLTRDTPTQLNLNTLDKAPWVDGALKFIVHGFSVDKDSAINAVLRPALFSVGEYNIVSTDWSSLGRQGCYTQAVRNVRTVGKCVSDFFNAVVRTRQFPSVHLLGHSMGAHVAAWASQDIPDLPRLTKFDVANPMFNNDHSRRGRAGFIDVYHSNCGLKGQRNPSGDVDVYFNNNVFQPGCKCDTGCSHLRAVEFYAESLSTPLVAFPCSGWDEYKEGGCTTPRTEDLVVLGENADIRVKGSFMAFTNSKSPFLLHADVYTEEASFNGFKNIVASECSIAYNFKTLLRDWL
ncbi:inactive pancreatic lipase-related protein 1-like [Macrosteles quadrilineatus]|uniref:inactive pancreatic lipase-related protein 1-like n=1 Tax=Macrosteles quadrilineatus TaxID=74068 RepID=UPI0023E32640|nr:inactive pancreatic lipase-related protein 1-like [Macrosteles quadrilineatus]